MTSKYQAFFFFIIISTKHPFSDVYKPDYSKHHLLGYSFLLHQPFQPFIPSSSPWYLMLKLHRTAHCSPNTPSLPGLFSITYPVPSAGNAVSPHSPAFLSPPAHLSRCAANLTFTCYMCCHPSTNPVAYWLSTWSPFLHRHSKYELLNDKYFVLGFLYLWNLAQDLACNNATSHWINNSYLVFPVCLYCRK